MIIHSQYFNNIWFTYHKSKNGMKNKMDDLLSIMIDFPGFCMNNRKNDSSVCKRCYAFIQTSIRRKSIWPKLKHNSMVFSTSSISFEKVITPLNVLRFNSYGELQNKHQLLNMILLARSNDHLYTALWSKRYKLVKPLIHLVPKNMIMVWSASKLNSHTFIIPKGFNKSFYVYTNEMELTKAKHLAQQKGYTVIECQKQCKECLHCYKDVSHTIVMELIK